ncbi:MAG: cobalt-precorrin 5A hydrolase [Eubacteriales bacterium]|nr:cobalt-precorrin 5A hydrolase [Eubacteriales bacterium]
MKISMICFSLTGRETGERLQEALKSQGHKVILDKKSKYLDDSIEESVSVWTGRQFPEADGILFIGACGIAVRSIAPYVVSKKADPAVLVADECGKYVISLLSGHLGGANDLAQSMAEILGAVPVITTATDLHDRFAVDVFAKRNRCAVFLMGAAKDVSAALLAGKQVGFYSEFPYEGELPQGLILCDKEGQPLPGGLSGRAGTHQQGQMKVCPQVGVAVTLHRDCIPFSSTVHVVPKILYLGMGCRKGKSEKDIFSLMKEVLDRDALYLEAAAGIASIGLKKDEPGFKALSESLSIPFETFSEEELQAVKGDFTPSAFVKSVAGVDNVCERSAVLASGQGRLIQRKQASGGVTAALAVRDWRIRFE